MIALVLEDEMPLMEAIKTKLQHHGWEVHAYRSVNEVVQFVPDLSIFSIIWLDHYLIGVKTGLDLLKRVKEDPKGKDVPVFVVTNTATQENVENYEKLGVVKYYIKSNVKLEDILTDIEETVKKLKEKKGTV